MKSQGVEKDGVQVVESGLNGGSRRGYWRSLFMTLLGSVTWLVLVEKSMRNRFMVFTIRLSV